jgi:hypothetical protein
LGVSRSALCQRLHVRPRPTPPADRLVAGLFILKRTHNLSDEVLCARWLENPYYQFFYGELSFCHKLPFDRSSLTHWRQRLGEEQRDVRSDAPRKSGSQWTRRWRKLDSNPWSHLLSWWVERADRPN